MSARRAILVVNATRPEAVQAATSLASLLSEGAFEIFTASAVSISQVKNVNVDQLPDAEIVIVLGGDGTILRGAEISRLRKIPLLGVNLGHVGFMAEVEKLSLETVAASVIAKSYATDPRMVLAYSVERDGKEVSSGWSLNEVTIERTESTMVELLVQVDRRPLSRWGCDGLIAATPTGSTAYAFSAGGPVLWPNLDAVVLLPISAHALFSRPMVISHKSEIVVEVESVAAKLSADALREFPLMQGDRVTITGDESVVLLAHVQPTLFTDRLVAKFKLPVEGWRGE
ncbi:MAG: NAD kinase [Candidatus Planktophila sp.]|jgi:NAD+ kinase|nr:NAD kinase [Candidatus Planktophila sp.]